MPESREGLQGSSGESRYRVGCAGMFVLGMDYGMDDEFEAIVAADAGPTGCEVYDTVTRQWIGPGCPEDVEYARAQLAAREQSA